MTRSFFERKPTRGARPRGGGARCFFPQLWKVFVFLSFLLLFGKAFASSAQVHDLPPQMGGCYSNGSVSAQENARRVLSGPFAAVPDCSYGPPEDARLEAVFAVCRHADKIVAANAVDCPTDDLDLALRGALTDLLRQGRLLPEENKEPHQLSQQQAAALLYVRDRVNVPRDMGLWPARHLREALSNAANRGRDDAPPSPPIAKNHRKDQDPKKFHKAGA